MKGEVFETFLKVRAPDIWNQAGIPGFVRKAGNTDIISLQPPTFLPNLVSEMLHN